MGACGGTTATHSKAFSLAQPDACVSDRDPAGCLRYLGSFVAVRSVRLTARVPQQVTATCLDAARMTRLKVVCPPLVPVGGVVHDHSLYGVEVVERRTYSASINNGQNAGYVHWEFGAIRGPATRLWAFNRRDWAAPPSTPQAMLIATCRYLGRVITIYRFPENGGQLGGHDAAFATDAGISYFVSIHGHNDDDADVAMLLAILLAKTRWAQ